MRRLSSFLILTWLVAGIPDAPAGRPPAFQEDAALQSNDHAQRSEKPASVSEVSVTPGSAGEVTIDVAMTKPATYHVYRFDHPDRLVMDVEGMSNAVREKLIPVSSSVVKDVRVGQFRGKDPEVVRVVADLAGNPMFDAQTYTGGVRLEVKPRPAAVSPAVAHAPTPADEIGSSHTAAAPRASSHESASSHAEAATPASTNETAASPASGRDRGSKRETVALRPEDFPPASPVETAARHEDSKPDYNATLPASESHGDATTAPRQAPQASTPEALKAEKAAQVHNIETASNPAGTPGTVPAGPEPSIVESPAYTGEQISLNLKDVDLKDFFRLIHEISGLNILVDPNVTGTVTMVLDNVPWDQALDIVLKNNGLGKVLEGNVLRIARQETLIAEQEAANRLAAQRLRAAPLVTVFRPVNYASANDIVTLFKTWSGGGGGEPGAGAGPLSERGSIMVDKRTNTLIISDVASQIPKIEETIAKLDTKTRQVAIEARIVLANSSFQRTLSAALLGTSSNTSGSTIGALQTGTGASITPSPTSPPTYTIPPNATTGFGVVAITNFSERYMIDAVLAAAEIRSQAKTISRPSIITQNNAEGMVQQGTQIPVQTTINNTISVQYVNATLQLSVTPQVTDDGHIFLKIAVQNASPGSIITNAAVSINIQQANTLVMVPDGGTVVFGGVTVTQRQNSVTQIPLLGNIPVLGNLFKSTNVQDTDQELLFFVSPRLLTT